MTEYEIYVMLDRGAWRAGIEGEPASIGGQDAGGTTTGLEDFVKSMVEVVKKGLQPGDKVEYIFGLPPWWDRQPIYKAKEEDVLALIKKYEDDEPELPKFGCFMGF
jgi:hypothetical protein